MTDKSSSSASRIFGPSDIILARAASDGDIEAFATLFRKWHPRFLALAQRLTGNRMDADDVMQEASIAIAKNIRRLSDPTKFLPWCYSIIRRRGADHIKRLAASRRRIDGEDDSADIADPSLPEDERFAVRQALSVLNETDRRLVLLFYSDGFSGPELSAALGLPLGTIKSRLSRIRQVLRTQLSS